MERPRKAPALERRVSEIAQDDIKVRVLGKIAERADDHFILEDETGRIRIERPTVQKEGSLVRIFGRPIELGKDMALEAEIVQDMAGLDEKLYKRWELLNRKKEGI